jgi:hypothetical protein
MKKLKTIGVILLFLFSVSLQAQYWDKEASSRYFVGGSGGLSFGNLITNIQVSPMVGFNISPRVNASTSIIYNYINDKFYSIETNIIGFRGQSELVVLKDLFEVLPVKIMDNVFLHAEYEMLGFTRDYATSISALGDFNGSRYLLHNFNYGIGFGMPMGSKSSLKLMLLGSYNDISYYIFDNPYLRIDLHIYLRKALPKKYRDGMD